MQLSGVPFFPRRNDALAVEGGDGAPGIALHLDAGDVLRLGPLETRLWQLCNGERSVDSIAATLASELDATVTPELVWRALDGMADAGVLVERPAPPASPGRVDRRGFLHRTLPGLAIASASAIPGVALAQSESNAKIEQEQSRKSDQEEAAKSTVQEQNQKRAQEQNQKLAQERDQKLAVQEQSQKIAAEQDNKSVESSQKSAESSDKNAAEQLSKDDLHSQEMERKLAAEQSAKGGSNPGGGNPAPEPATLVLFGAALAALAASRYAGGAATPSAEDDSADGGR